MAGKNIYKINMNKLQLLSAFLFILGICDGLKPHLMHQSLFGFSPNRTLKEPISTVLVCTITFLFMSYFTINLNINIIINLV